MKKRLIKLIVLLSFYNNFLCINEKIGVYDGFFNDFKTEDLRILQNLTDRKLKIINNLLKICNVFKKFSKDDIKKIIECKIRVEKNIISKIEGINNYIYSEKEGFTVKK